ncbi:MAG: ubiquinone/menaquinone biosynthesis C-methylase UbiE, partial [Cellvibrionaceae bacterium]
MSYKESHINRSHDYDKGILADDFGRYMLEREASILNKIIPRLGRYSGVQGPGETYLDFACGTGRVTQIFEQHFPVSFGVDVSENMISVAK